MKDSPAENSTMSMPPPRKQCSWLLAICLAAGSTAAFAKPPAGLFKPQQIDGAELRYVSNVPVALLGGSPDEIGRQHAALLEAPGKKIMAFPRRFADVFGVGAFWPFMAQAGRTLIMQTPERYQRELAAIAAHSELGEDTLAVGNTLLELRRMGCSAIVVEPQRSVTGGPLFGRNFDFPTLGDLDQYSMLFVYRPADKRAFASVGFPGLVGVFSGMNDAGLAVATLDVERSADGSRKFNPTGTPLAFVFRRILEECATVDEAETLLRSVKPTTWMNLVVCDRHEGATFEITPDRIGRRDDEDHLVRCTNHFRCKGLSVGEICRRYDCLLDLPTAAPLDVAAVQRRLDAANQNDITLQTMVFEPRELTLHLAIGKPPTSDDPLVKIELQPLFTAELE